MNPVSSALALATLVLAVGCKAPAVTRLRPETALPTPATVAAAAPQMPATLVSTSGQGGCGTQAAAQPRPALGQAGGGCGCGAGQCSGNGSCCGGAGGGCPAGCPGMAAAAQAAQASATPR